MGELDGRVAIITGAGRGLGRAHALLFAAEGARVLVNDRGTAVDGTGGDRDLVAAVVEEIRAAGGTAVASTLDVALWESGERLVAEALDAFGDLHILVNNAGILRDRALVNMSEQDWDVIMQVDLKGHFVPTRFAATYWRSRSKAGEPVDAAIVNTVSTSGLVGNPGQSHYGTAKAGLAAFTIICAQELGRYGVRVNAIAPSARTRMTESSPGLAKFLEAPADPNMFDTWDPANISPLVAYLASSGCDVTGRVFLAQGGKVQVYEPWTLGGTIERHGRWSIDELRDEVPHLLG